MSSQKMLLCDTCGIRSLKMSRDEISDNFYFKVIRQEWTADVRITIDA